MKESTMLLLGGGALAAYLLLSNNSASNATGVAVNNPLSALIPSLNPTSGAATSTGQTVLLGQICPGIGAAYASTVVPYPPSVFTMSYYLAYQYPALTKNNPNLLNPGYQLTGAELSQYAANYVDVATGVRTWKSNGGDFNKNLQMHWTQHGVAEQRCFNAFLPTDQTPYTPPPSNGKTSSGGSFLSDAGKVVSAAAPIIVALAGVGEDDSVPLLNDFSLATLVQGSAVLKQLLPMFYLKDPKSIMIEDAIDNTLNYYL